MISELLNRDVVLYQLEQIVEDLRTEITQGPRQDSVGDAGQTGLEVQLRGALEQERSATSGQLGYESPPAERRGGDPAPIDDYAFFSRDPIISLTQSALDEHYTVLHPEEVLVDEPLREDDRRSESEEAVVSDRHLSNVALQRTEDGRRVFDRFSVTDIRWVRSKIAEGVRLYTDKHAFHGNPAEPLQLPGRARILLVGDWGTGLPRALSVAREMQHVLSKGLAENLTQHVIHLGDVYYSGWAHEYNRRVLPHWPVGRENESNIGSWFLNGNHDMYSGGYGYFDVLLSDHRFAPQRQSSFFSLVHPKWKIFGVDTAWMDATLCDPQPIWLRDELSDRSRHHLLLSHHQLFSAYETVDAGLGELIRPILESHPARGWYWGHEHRCVAYEPHASVEFARCIGHGGVPVYMSHNQEDRYPSPVAYEYRRFKRKGLERWALMGFVILDFFPDGVLTETFVDENGNEHHHNKFV